MEEEMQSEERKKVVSTILGKTLLYIVAVGLAFALIVWAWEKYDWLPFVKSIIRGVEAIRYVCHFPYRHTGVCQCRENCTRSLHQGDECCQYHNIIKRGNQEG